MTFDTESKINTEKEYLVPKTVLSIPFMYVFFLFFVVFFNFGVNSNQFWGPLEPCRI